MKILIRNMSNYYKAFLLMSIITLVGCEKRLDISPYQSIADDKALLTESDVLVTMIGCYDGIQNAAAYGGDIMVLNDLIGNSSNINFTGTFAGLSDAYQTQMTADNSFAGTTWIAAYNTINRCNNVLSAIDKVTSSTTKKNAVEGQALFLRASMYFELVKLYAKFVGDGDYSANPGVPLVLTPTGNVTDADYTARASVKAVYDKVIADLTKAESLLPATNGNYATKWAAAAQLSRVYLMLKDYAGARDAADRVISGSGKSLNPDFTKLWFTFINNAGSTPSEYLFAIKVTAQDGTNSQNTYFGRTISSIPGTAGRSDCKIKAAHIALYEAGDVRKSFFVLSGGNYYTQKHLDRFGDVAVIRLAEMYLTRAEANQRLGTTVGATPLDDVNRVRNRVGIPALTTVSLADITKERFLELAFEGHNLIEAKRLQTSVGSLAWNDAKLILPIPRREIDVNKNLVQNQGY
ncbi:MAG: RagB/SusD family nutrient uptake outer membrane protein [Sediminibacterium sp.]|nr:RagB/SusD family nutrient uptake outer membrane protein [Sediminibacterium sp.]MDP3129676.1 RagB/SusD family nutrient uptake outer membrane protein [Sediminibacterium sp.]